MIGAPTNNNSPVNSNYPTGDIASFIEEFNQPKQDMNLDIAEGLDALEPLEEDMPTGKLDTTATRAAAGAGGRMIAAVIDTTIPMTLGMIAKESPDEFKATDSQREELEAALTEYMALRGDDIPPGVMVLILVLTIYGSQVPHALALRKQNLRQEQLDQREEELKRLERELKDKAKALEKKEEKESERCKRNIYLLVYNP